MQFPYFLLLLGVLLLAAGAASLYFGKTIGLYGVMETRASVFYWIIVITYLGLGGGCLFSAIRLILRS